MTFSPKPPNFLTSVLRDVQVTSWCASFRWEVVGKLLADLIRLGFAGGVVLGLCERTAVFFLDGWDGGG